ncbi:MAG: hypothetical protein JW969_08235 [Spirochaetales bacterium]|nr:hypothetical protein [Spirochaetales bacterium]
MKRILFTGNSITRGKIGCSYMPFIAECFPGYELMNLGQDGDTVSGIMQRTLVHLQRDSNYDAVIIIGGHNDIILPEFEHKSPFHKTIVRNLRRTGSIPAGDYNDFISIYRIFIDKLKNITPVPLAVATLSCINEDLSVSTNKKRKIYNQGIRNIAVEKNVELVDIAEEFNRVLQNAPCQDYLMDDIFPSYIFDVWKSKTKKGLDRLSQKRLLHLTIDGIHLNSRGAEIYGRLLVSFIKTLK